MSDAQRNYDSLINLGSVAKGLDTTIANNYGIIWNAYLTVQGTARTQKISSSHTAASAMNTTVAGVLSWSGSATLRHSRITSLLDPNDGAVLAWAASYTSQWSTSTSDSASVVEATKQLSNTMASSATVSQTAIANITTPSVVFKGIVETANPPTGFVRLYPSVPSSLSPATYNATTYLGMPRLPWGYLPYLETDIAMMAGLNSGNTGLAMGGPSTAVLTKLDETTAIITSVLSTGYGSVSTRYSWKSGLCKHIQKYKTTDNIALYSTTPQYLGGYGYDNGIECSAVYSGGKLYVYGASCRPTPVTPLETTNTHSELCADIITRNVTFKIARGTTYKHNGGVKVSIGGSGLVALIGGSDSGLIGSATAITTTHLAAANTVEVYNPATGTTTVLPTMPVKFIGSSFIKLNDYTILGICNTKSCWTDDVITLGSDDRILVWKVEFATDLSSYTFSYRIDDATYASVSTAFSTANTTSSTIASMQVIGNNIKVCWVKPTNTYSMKFSYIYLTNYFTGGLSLNATLASDTLPSNCYSPAMGCPGFQRSAWWQPLEMLTFFDGVPLYANGLDSLSAGGCFIALKQIDSLNINSRSDAYSTLWVKNV